MLFRSRKSSVWDSYAPPFDQMAKRFFGRNFSWAWLACIPLALIIVATWDTAAHAQDEALTPEDVQFVLDNIWVLVAAVLVIFMNAGFGMLETGFCRQKNAVNILSKNLIVFALATLSFWVLGFGLMFNEATPFIGLGNFFLSGFSTDGPEFGNLTAPVFFLFQAAFAGTADRKSVV